MRNTRVLFGVSLFAGVAVAVGVGCGSSSKSGGTPPPAADSSTPEDAASDGPSGGNGSGCGPIGSGVTSCDPGMGLTCCIDLSNISNIINAVTNGGSIGTCMPTAQCMGTIQYQCLMPSDCSSGSSCCLGTTGDASALLNAFEDAGDASFTIPDSGFDAAGIDASSLLSGVSFDVACQPNGCSASQFTLCASNSDCSALPGYVCAAPPSALLGSGASIDGFSASMLVSIMVCQSPDAGGVTPTEAGTGEKSDAGTDAGEGATDAAPSDGATSGG
jgi:hypothetical protein